MKQRITYILPSGTALTKSDIAIRGDTLHFSKASQAAEEWKVTLALDELSNKLRHILEDSHEFHLRWSRPTTHLPVPPLLGALPSGLHIFFTPRNSVEGANVSLCALLRRLASSPSIKCHSVTDSFSKPPILSERFATTPTYQYYQLVDAGIDVGRLFLSQLCVLGSQGTPVLSACETQLEEVTYADYIDVDFDAISHALTFTAFWSAPRVTANLAAIRRASRSPRKLKSSDRLEVGVLQSESATEPNELSLGGFLTVLGEDDQPNSVLFSFPSRHHTLPNASFNTIFQRPTGLHPTLEFTLPTQHLHAPDPSCKLHAYLTLPSALFIDRYQFTDALFLRSHNLIALHSLSGETDLEAPDWTIQRWGSAALFELATPFDPFDSTSPDPFPNSDDWTITLPLHLRYLAPDSSDSSSSTSHRNLPIPNPVLFYACPAPLHASPNTNNPFDRLHLGYDGLFTPDTIFHHILPMAGSGQGVLEIDVPVLDVGYASQGTVQAWTGMVVVSGFLWVCWRLFAGARKKEKGGGEGQRRG